MENGNIITDESAPADDIRVLRSTTCLSLSGKNTLGLDWGCDQHSQVLLRLASSSGGGLFNRDWLPLSSFSSPEGEPIVGADYKALFVFKSANTPGFYKAALQSENLISAEGYRAFLAKAQAWMDGTAPEEQDTIQKATALPKRKATLSLKPKSKKAS